MLTATIAGCGPSDMDDDRPTHVHSCCACELMAAGESALGTRGPCGETEDSIFPARSVRGDSGPTRRPLHQVEHALRERFQLWLQNPNKAESPISDPTGGKVRIER